MEIQTSEELRPTYFLTAFSNNSPLNSGTPNFSSAEVIVSLITTTFGFFSAFPAFVVFFTSSGAVSFFLSSDSPSFDCCCGFPSFFSSSSAFPSLLSGSCFLPSSSVTGFSFSSTFPFIFSSEPAAVKTE
jgi:hypothetical protein